MKWLDFRLIPVSTVKPPVDIDARIANPHVAALAANIKALGEQSQNAPVVQDGTNEIISGRDRYAAYLINGADELWVHVADATAAERADMEESENLFRRPVANRDELLARRSAKLADALIVTDVTAKDAKAAARKQTAIEAGTTPAAVKQAEHRVRSKSQEKTARRPAPFHGEQLSGETGAELGPGEPDRSAPVEPAIDMMGELASEEWLIEMAVIVGIVEGVDRELRQLQSACKALPQPLQQRMRDALHTAGAAARALRPEIVCAACRDPDGVKGKRTECFVCSGNGWLSKEAKGGMHPATLTPAAPVVAKKATTSVAQSSIKHARNTILIETPEGGVPFVDVPDPTDADAPEEGDAF